MCNQKNDISIIAVWKTMSSLCQTEPGWNVDTTVVSCWFEQWQKKTYIAVVVFFQHYLNKTDNNTVKLWKRFVSFLCWKNSQRRLTDSIVCVGTRKKKKKIANYTWPFLPINRHTGRRVSLWQWSRAPAVCSRGGAVTLSGKTKTPPEARGHKMAALDRVACCRVADDEPRVEQGVMRNRWADCC